MLNTIIDCSHWNSIDPTLVNEHNFQQIYDFGIRAVINKATQGTSFIDPSWKERHKECVDLGMKIGFYHFGNSENPVVQAKHFLDTTQPDSKTLVALDFEPNGIFSMHLWQAETFVQEVFKQLGRYPVLYTGRYYLDRVGYKPGTNSTLEKCPLWLAAYNDTPPKHDGWDKLTFWQWSNGSSGTAFSPINIPGHGALDRDAFIGTQEEFDAFWDWTPKQTIDKVETF